MSRCIPSITPTGWELRTALRIKPKMVLISFFYFDGLKKEKKIESLRLLKDSGVKVMVDSGIYSLKVKYGKGIFAITKAHGALTKVEKEKTIEFFTRDYARYEEFHSKYINFLREYGNDIECAIDLDVDQFLGLETAENWYGDIVKVFPTQKLLRVWHATRDFVAWENWCDSGKFSYLAVEGGTAHGYNPEFYTPFVEYAHSKNIKVHILAMTSENMLKYANFDTGDSTTYQVGARYGQIITPWGHIHVSDRDNKDRKDSFKSLDRNAQVKILEMLESHGFDFDMMLESKNNIKASEAGIERSAWNMYYCENLLGKTQAVISMPNLTMFEGV